MFKTMFKTLFKPMFKIMFKTVFKTIFKTMIKTVFKTMFKTMFKAVFRTIFEKLKKMSFLKITDPKKRYFIVNEFIKTTQNIQENFLSERVSDLSTQLRTFKALQTSYGHAKRFKRRPCKRIETN